MQRLVFRDSPQKVGCLTANCRIKINGKKAGAIQSRPANSRTAGPRPAAVSALLAATSGSRLDGGCVFTGALNAAITRALVLMRYLLRWLTVPALLTLAACVSNSPRQTRRAPGDLPGPRADGSVLLPNQWSLRPVGRQVVLGDFPVNIAMHPGGRFAGVLHSGHGRHQITVVDVPAAKVVGEFPVDEAFYGIEFSRDGKGLFCSGAGDEVIHAFAFKDGYLFDPKVFKLRDVKERGIPAGMALSSDARRLFVANVWGQRISRVDLDDAAKVTDITLGASNELVRPTTPATVADEDTAAASKRAQAALEKISDESPFPYACRLDEKRHRLYVSLWAQAAVAVVDLNANQVTARWPT